MANINKEIYDLLLEKELTISFCESASGGALSSMMCDIDGVSKVFMGSIVSYDNSIKINVVDIDKSIVEKYGAVSEEVAYHMSKNTNQIMKTDICISITGNAGANPMEDKETGLYYVGITLIDKTDVFKFELKNSTRNYNRFNIA